MCNRRFLGVIFVVLMPTLSGSAPALAGGTAAEACAAHDLAVFNLIEQHGEDQSLPAQAIADAAMTLIAARVACRDGREAEAIAIYAGLNAALAAAAGHR